MNESSEGFALAGERALIEGETLFHHLTLWVSIALGFARRGALHDIMTHDPAMVKSEEIE
jgi:hypothetical protein